MASDKAGLVLDKLVESIILEDCFEMHWLVKSGQIDTNEILGIEPIPKDGWKDLGNASAQGPKKGNGVGIGGQTSKNGGTAKIKPGYSLASTGLGSQIAQCPICTQLVAGSRFAPHLERCLGGGKRAGRAHFSSLEEIILKKAKPQPFVDPYPNSVIIRVKLRAADGIPHVKQQREGVSKEEWNQAVKVQGMR